MKTLLCILLFAVAAQAQTQLTVPGSYAEQGFSGRCPVCVKEGKRSEVYEGHATTTLAATYSYYDKDGKYHYSDPNTTTINYNCSMGHRFSVSYADGKQFVILSSVGAVVQSPQRREANIICRVREVQPSFSGQPLISAVPYGLTVLSCVEGEQAFTWEIPEDNWPGVWGFHRHAALPHIAATAVRAGRDSKGNLIPACRVSQDCHPADAACLQIPPSANRACDLPKD